MSWHLIKKCYGAEFIPEGCHFMPFGNKFLDKKAANDDSFMKFRCLFFKELTLNF
jgi:hypothetical protein